MNKVRIIQVQTDEAAARQVRLHRLQALSIAVIVDLYNRIAIQT
ncbi:hypothetical protein Q0M94_22625 (plasmid) [Deinococcus radiomollis]